METNLEIVHYCRRKVNILEVSEKICKKISSFVCEVF